MPKKLDPRQKRVVIGVALVVHVAAATLTWRDLRRRPRSAVRGNPNLWRTLSVLNTMWSAVYWTLGRRRHWA